MNFAGCYEGSFHSLGPEYLKVCLIISIFGLGNTTFNELAFRVFRPCLSKYISISLHNLVGAVP